MKNCTTPVFLGSANPAIAMICAAPEGTPPRRFNYPENSAPGLSRACFGCHFVLSQFFMVGWEPFMFMPVSPEPIIILPGHLQSLRRSYPQSGGFGDSKWIRGLTWIARESDDIQYKFSGYSFINRPNEQAGSDNTPVRYPMVLIKNYPSVIAGQYS